MKHIAGSVMLLCLLILTLTRAGWADSRYILVTILHTNDLHGSVMPRDQAGGLARAATLIKQIRADMPNVLLLDAGDIIHGSAEDYFSNGKATITAMDTAGYQAATTGNHEYDFGLQTLKDAMGATTFPFLAANVHAAAGGQWENVAPDAIFIVDGVRIGVLGLTTLETVTLHWPGSIKDIVVDDPVKTAQTMVPQLRTQADVVVVLSHLGEPADLSLAKTVPGIDFIVGGHTHTVIDKWTWVGNTLVAQTGAYGRSLGRIDFIVQADETGAKIASVNGKASNWNTMQNPPLGKKYPDGPLIPVDDLVPEDEAVVKAYMPFRTAADERLAEVIGNAPQAISGVNTGSGDIPAGNLLADAVREYAKSDVAIIDPASVGQTGIPAGPVSVKTCFDLIQGFTRQQIVVAQMTGTDIKLALEKRLIGKKGVSEQVSGCSFTYTVNGTGGKISDLKVGNTSVDPNATYTFATQAYVMMEVLPVTPSAKVISEPSDTTREVLIGYVRNHKSINPPDIDRMKKSVPPVKPAASKQVGRKS